MRAVIQRVSRAGVTVDGEVTGDIGRGFLVLLGVAFVLLSTKFPMADLAANTSVNFLQSYLFFGALLLLWQLYRLRKSGDVQRQRSYEPFCRRCCWWVAPFSSVGASTTARPWWIF